MYRVEVDVVFWVGIRMYVLIRVFRKGTLTIVRGVFLFVGFGAFYILFVLSLVIRDYTTVL